MKTILAVTFALGLALAFYACGGKEYKCEECGETFATKEALKEHVMEVHARGGAGEPTEETLEEPTEATADLAGIKAEFKSAFDEVNRYMETHNQSNTSADALSAAYSGFAGKFGDMKAKYETVKTSEKDKAEYDRMIALMAKASDSMSKYSEGIKKGIPDGIALSLEGATLWDEVKKDFGGVT